MESVFAVAKGCSGVFRPILGDFHDFGKKWGVIFGCPKTTLEWTYHTCEHANRSKIIWDPPEYVWTLLRDVLTLCGTLMWSVGTAIRHIYVFTENVFWGEKALNKRPQQILITHRSSQNSLPDCVMTSAKHIKLWGSGPSPFWVLSTTTRYSHNSTATCNLHFPRWCLAMPRADSGTPVSLNNIYERARSNWNRLRGLRTPPFIY